MLKKMLAIVLVVILLVGVVLIAQTSANFANLAMEPTTSKLYCFLLLLFSLIYVVGAPYLLSITCLIIVCDLWKGKKENTSSEEKS